MSNSQRLWEGQAWLVSVLEVRLAWQILCQLFFKLGGGNEYFSRAILSMMSKLKPEGSNASPLHAHLVRVESGHKSCSGWRAFGLGVEPEQISSCEGRILFQIKNTNSSDLLYAMKIRPVLIICNLFRMTPSLARPSSTGVILVTRVTFILYLDCWIPFFRLMTFQFLSFWSPFWIVPRNISPAEIIGEDIEEVGLRPKTGIWLQTEDWKKEWEVS